MAAGLIYFVAILAIIIAVIFAIGFFILRRQVRRKVGEVLTSEAKYRNLLENIGIGVAMISPDMKILTLNKQMRE
jgi:PAS domain-containing protein